MAKKTPKAEWDKVAEWWNTEAGDSGVWHQRHDIDPVVFDVLGSVKNKIILEIGCGNGYLSRLLAERGAKITAVDLSKKFIRIAKEKESAKPLGIKYFVRDAANLYGIKSRQFDVVISSMMLMDVADAQEVIKEAGRVVKKGGRIVFSITHPVFIEGGQKWVRIRIGRKDYSARAVTKYLIPHAKKVVLWVSGAKATQYYRPFSEYFKYLKKAGFLVADLREIATRKKIKKATAADGDVRFRGSRYRTLAEKRMKKMARKEIPIFLVVEAIKII